MARDRPLFGQGERPNDTEDRAVSIAVSHALLLALVFGLIGGVVTAASGPIINAQGELVTTVAVDKFDDWDETVESVIATDEAHRQSMEVPTGVYLAGGATTNITIAEGGTETEIETNTFRFSPRGDDRIVRHDTGLTTRATTDLSTPSVVSTPDQTSYSDGGEQILTLRLTEYNVTETALVQRVYTQDTLFDIYPRSEKSTEQEYGDNTVIEVSGQNYVSWERYFNNSQHYHTTDVDVDDKTVTAEVEATQFNVAVDHVEIIRSGSEQAQ